MPAHCKIRAPSDPRLGIRWVETPQGDALEFRPEIEFPIGERKVLPPFPDLAIDPKKMPMVDQKPMDIVAGWTLWVAYHMYKINGRHLTGEDCEGIIRMVFYETWSITIITYEKLETFDNEYDIKCRSVSDQKYLSPWAEQIGIFYHKLLKKDPAANARNEALNGL